MAESSKKNILTYAGLQELEAELEDLKVNKRKEVAQKIKEAREQGDLSENAEYDAAKNEQAELEERIMKLEAMIRNARILDESEITSDRVNLGHTVKVMYMETGEVETYKIVGSNEADPLAGMISNESAIGRGLIGVGLDEEVQIEIPDGVVTLKVLEITRE